MIVATLFYLFLGGLLLLVYRVLSARSVEVERVIIERIAAFVAGVDGDVVAIGRGVTRKDLVRSLAFVAEMTTEQASDRVRIIMKYYHLESYMLRRIFASRHDSQRAYLLALMSRLPISMLAALRVEPLAYAKSTEVGFYALAAIFAVTPLRGVATLARMSHRLSRRDVAELLSVVNRGSCPVPYTPLLLSENYNLQLLGLYLVRRFAIAESRREIATIVKNRSSELRDDALSVLASFGEVMIEYEGGKCRIV